ncbi:50S ribosomal protein L11 methyltransferase [Campylobacter geochelonis]|uniref:50S ribosomal protein L11 methyltransferase n=1 Tax=Campylobacter geochelonis TaxID=1780362 RepID=UPI00077077F5|nr:50S ribosomal protein L11 methyltransferase [Campylobacter geochelonis]CZE46992.1 ribosomal protein L11 methyltransferase [Campylobacter geochelonis]
MSDNFFELTISSTNAISLFKDFVFELGIECVEERENSFIIRDEDSLENIEFALLEYKKMFEKELNLAIDLSLNLQSKENIDWIEQYKKGVSPVEVGEIYIHPSWEEPKNGLLNVVIDPALAFGSGHHESTNMCLELIQKYKNGYKTALDVGCGSGILSISLKKLGLEVLACDTDEQAIQASVENASKNGVSIDKTWVGSISNLDKKCDMVVANIIADVILMLKKELILSVKDGGVLILSGILEKYLERIKDSFKELKFVEFEQKNEWVSLVFKKEREI